MVWNSVDDENFCHEGNFTKGKSDGNGIRLVFMFRWLSKQHWIDPETIKVVELQFSLGALDIPSNLEGQDGLNDFENFLGVRMKMVVDDA